jgi:hypothetical protein
VPFVAVVILGIAGLFGWIVIGQIIGERLLVANGRAQPSLGMSSVVGVSVLTLLTNMPVVGEIPCIGFLLGLIGSIVGIGVALTGIGAVLLTRFGTRPYLPSEYSYAGGSSATRSPSGGRPARWTEPDLDLSEENAASSEEELNAKIKAALTDADAPPEAKPEDELPEKKPKKPKNDEPSPGPDDEEPKAEI